MEALYRWKVDAQGFVLKTIYYSLRPNEIPLRVILFEPEYLESVWASSHVQLGCTTSYCLCMALGRRPSGAKSVESWFLEDDWP